MEMVAGISTNDGRNDKNTRTVVVFSTYIKGSTGMGTMEVNRFRMSGLTGPSTDWTIINLSSLVS